MVKSCMFASGEVGEGEGGRNQAGRCRACARKSWQGGCLKRCGEEGEGNGFDVGGMER